MSLGALCARALRFERAFGVIPGILAAGLCLGSYHIGTYPLDMVFRLGIVGLIYGVVFRLTRNLLILWPLTWTVASTMGTVSGGFTFGWQTVRVYAVIILIQGTGIWWISNIWQKQKNSKNDGFSSMESYVTKKNRWWREWAISGIYSFMLVSQIVFTYFNYNTMDLNNIANAGWLVMTVSAFFGWIPIFTFRRKGGVQKGKSYIHTTILVDSGIYGIVRHPQFFAGILVSLALVLMSQHWVNLVLFIPVFVGTYIDSLRADKRLIEKFGESYESYMMRVSGLNPLVGISNLFKKHMHKNQVSKVV